MIDLLIKKKKKGICCLPNKKEIRVIRGNLNDLRQMNRSQYILEWQFKINEIGNWKEYRFDKYNNNNNKID